MNLLTRRKQNVSSREDIRNLNYPVTLSSNNTCIKSTEWNCDIRLNQGREGSCVGHGIAHHLATNPTVMKKVNSELATEIYKLAQFCDQWAGENYSGTSLSAGMSVAKNLGFYKSYTWAKTALEIIQSIVSIGPVILAVDWYYNMGNPLKGQMSMSGKKTGRHCVVAIGYNIESDKVLILNSWGKRWGNGGTAWLPTGDLQRLMTNRGVACVPTQTPTKN